MLFNIAIIGLFIFWYGLLLLIAIPKTKARTLMFIKKYKAFIVLMLFVSVIPVSIYVHQEYFSTNFENPYTIMIILASLVLFSIVFIFDQRQGK